MRIMSIQYVVPFPYQLSGPWISDRRLLELETCFKVMKICKNLNLTSSSVSFRKHTGLA
jgi:hypothetical protein